MLVIVNIYAGIPYTGEGPSSSTAPDRRQHLVNRSSFDSFADTPFIYRGVQLQNISYEQDHDRIPRKHDDPLSGIPFTKP